jgi:hypothetical protein
VTSRISVSKAGLIAAVAVLEKELRIKLQGRFFEDEELRAMVVAVAGALTTSTVGSAHQPWMTFDPRRLARQAVTDAVDGGLVAADDGGARSATEYAGYVIDALSALEDDGS